MNLFELREVDGAFDFLVDGVSLREVLVTDDISTLRQWQHPQGFARELLDTDGSLKGRVPIYACRECYVYLDTWCGGYAVRVSRSNGRIVWHEIEKFSNSVGDNGVQLDFTPTGVGPFEFDLAHYRSAIEPSLA